MALYQYTSIDPNGKRKKGLIEATTLQEAKEKIREMGLILISLSLKTKMNARQSLKGEALLSFTLQLSQLVSAGVPLYESLKTIEEQSRNESYHRILASLCEQIKSGTPLSLAMSQYPNSFDKLYCSMIKAGEAVGALDVVLEALSRFISRQLKLKGDIITAMVYPAVLAIFSFLIIIIMLTFVVPSIEGIFSDRKLNGFTQFVLSISHFFSDYWGVYIPFLVLTGIVIYRQLNSSKGKKMIEEMLLKTPVIKTLIIQTAILKFSRTMGTLLTGGLPLIEALKISKDVMKNEFFAGEISKAEIRIIEGSSLGKEFARIKLFPPMVAQMLTIGENSGGIIIMFNKIGDMYEQNLEKTLNRLLALAQPAILIFMGAIIGMILLAILVPLTDISSLAL